MGEGVTEFSKGDHVLTVFTGECKTCKQCTSGKSNICQVLGLERRGLMHSDQKTRFFIKGKPVYHYCAVSSFSEYIVVHSGCAVKVNSDVPLEKICLLSCGVAAGNFMLRILCIHRIQLPYFMFSYFSQFQFCTRNFSVSVGKCTCQNRAVLLII